MCMYTNAYVDAQEHTDVTMGATLGLLSQPFP